MTARFARACAILSAIVVFVFAPPRGFAGEPTSPTVAQTIDRFASPDGRCRFANPRVTLRGLAPAADRRIAQTLRVAFMQTDARVGRTATHAERIAACRAALADVPRDVQPTPTYEDTSTLRVAFDRDGVLAASVTRLQGSSASAHPNTTYRAYVFDVASGRAYGTHEMFRRGSDAALRRLVVADLHRQDLAHPSEPDTAPLYASGPPHFGEHDVLLVPGGVEVYNLFDFHAAAGVVGYVSASDLRASGIVSPAGPLRVLLR
ncbi:MAG: hypothetical protein NVS2B3_01960 [Vulcanimicrobiaceae bacterium]